MQTQPHSSGSAALQPRRPARRRVKEATRLDLERRIGELVKYQRAHGSFDVPRSGKHAGLGDWLDKLKETFCSRPDGSRIQWVREEAPEVFRYLSEWKAGKQPRKRAGRTPFWLMAAWAMDFMHEHRRAPWSRSANRNEVRLATWMRRWTKRHGLEMATQEHARYRVAIGLLKLSRDVANVVEKDPAYPACSYANDLFAQIAQLCLGCNRATPMTRAQFAEAIAAKKRFWPSMEAAR